MASGPGLYSRLVAILKVLLPLVAVGLLAALFLIPAEDEPGGAVVFSKGDIAALGEGLQITNPTFSGMTRAEDSFRFDADLVVPDAAPPTSAEITALRGRIAFVGGPEVALASLRGALDIPRDLLELEGDVRVDTSDGYVLHADHLSVDLAAGVLEAGDTVSATGPMGRIDAGHLRIEPSGSPDEARRFLFGNGVVVVYDPPAEPE